MQLPLHPVFLLLAQAKSGKSRCFLPEKL